MVSFTDALSEGLRQSICATTRIENALARLAYRTLGFPDLTQIASDAAGWDYRRACNREPTPFNPGSPPFTGGQCDGIAYIVTFKTTSIAWDNTVTTQTGTTPPLAGRIKGISATWDGDIGNSRKRLFVDGNVDDFEIGSVPVSSAPDPFAYKSFEGQILSVSRVDGLPDNCGDPPPTPPQPPDDFRDTNIVINYNDDSGNPVSIPITVHVGDFNLDARANFTIPLTINISPTLNVRADFNFGDGTINFHSPAPTGGAPQPPGDSRPGNQPGDYRTPISPPPPPPDTPQPPPPDPNKPEKSQVLRGVIVTVTGTNEIQSSVLGQSGGNPDVYLPDLGLVQFYCQVGSSGGAWTEDIRVKNKRQIIECPWEGGAIAVDGTPRAGVTWNLTPVYRLEETAQDT